MYSVQCTYVYMDPYPLLIPVMLPLQNIFVDCGSIRNIPLAGTQSKRLYVHMYMYECTEFILTRIMGCSLFPDSGPIKLLSAREILQTFKAE